jgi:arylsulfatase A-like enzyme
MRLQPVAHNMAATGKKPNISFIMADDIGWFNISCNDNGIMAVGDVAAILDGPAQPTFNFNSTSVWAQGVNIGLSMAF